MSLHCNSATCACHGLVSEIIKSRYGEPYGREQGNEICLQRWFKYIPMKTAWAFLRFMSSVRSPDVKNLLTQPPCICCWCARAGSASTCGRTRRKMLCYNSACALTGWVSSLKWPCSTPWSTLSGRPRLAWRVRTTPFPLLRVNSSSWRSPLAGWTSWTWVKIPHNYQTEYLTSEWTDWPTN